MLTQFLCRAEEQLAALIYIFPPWARAQARLCPAAIEIDLQILHPTTEPVGSCGIFLFTEDDPLEGVGGGAAPRDNVVFEAGYFMSSKGPSRCLIIREGEAKMPADVGGAIYLHLKRGQDVTAIQGSLADFVKSNL